MPLRIAITGMEHGPDLKKIISCLGIKEVCNRIKETVECLI